MILEAAQNVKVSKTDLEKYKNALRSFPHFLVYSEELDPEGVVKCFRIEVSTEHPRPAILARCAARYNKLNTAQVREYLVENAQPGKPGRRAKNGKE